MMSIKRMICGDEYRENDMRRGSGGKDGGNMVTVMVTMKAVMEAMSEAMMKRVVVVTTVG